MFCDDCEKYFGLIEDLDSLERLVKMLLKAEGAFKLEYLGHGKNGPTMSELKSNPRRSVVDNFFGCTSCGGLLRIEFDSSAGCLQHVDDDEADDIKIIHG